MQGKIFTTTCIDWDDGDWDTEARSAKEAAEKHAAEGWMSEPPTAADCVTIRVNRSGRETLWIVVGDGERQTAARAPAYLIEGLISAGMIIP